MTNKAKGKKRTKRLHKSGLRKRAKQIEQLVRVVERNLHQETMCRHCMVADLHWTEDGEGHWALFDKDGNYHNCNLQPVVI